MEIHSNQKRVKDDRDVDRISNLPDEIRSHILSFMPSKSALKMSVLSQKWKHLWTQLPVLDFSARLTTQQITHFKNFVHMLLLHNDVPFLRFLNLDLCGFRWDDICCINSWLDTIAKRDIHEIKIRCMTWGQPRVALPTNFLSRERLVVLTLTGNFYIDNKMLLDLPNLEAIHFRGVKFPNDGFMKRMLSGCLVLKDLIIEDFRGISNSLFVESLSLRRLRISCEIEQVCIVIRTPNLRCLDLRDNLNQNLICNLSSLDVAYLNLDYERADYALQVLQLTSGVTKLSLSNVGYLRCISKPPIFQNLIWLELDDAENLWAILGCASKLKYLIFRWEAYADESLKSEAVPVCLSSLEVVHFQWFEGVEEEYEFVAYMLKFASMLKEMKFFIRSSEIKTHYKRLMKLPRSSNSCRLIATFGPPPKEDGLTFDWGSYST